MKITGPSVERTISEDSTSDGENKFIKSVEKSATNIGIEEEVHKQINDLQPELEIFSRISRKLVMCKFRFLSQNFIF